jgi:hypothetical protein
MMLGGLAPLMAAGQAFTQAEAVPLRGTGAEGGQLAGPGERLELERLWQPKPLEPLKPLEPRLLNLRASLVSTMQKAFEKGPVAVE